MNYIEHYNKLIERAKTRLLEGYSEQHHVVPRCLGGSDAADNLVRLTAEEHYVAHQLLVKMYPGHRGLIKAACMMALNANGNRPDNKMYGWLKQQHSIAQSKAMTGVKRGPMTEEHKRKISAAHKGMKHSIETRRKISELQTGKKRGPMSEETKRKIGLANSGPKPDRKQSVESNAKRSATLKGRKFSAETIAKMKLSAQARENRKRGVV